MNNLLRETISILHDNGKSWCDVIGVIVPEGRISKYDFLCLSNVNYDDSNYNAPVINPDLYIVGNGFWLERKASHTTGKEFWKFNKVPDIINLPFITIDTLKDKLCEDSLYNIKPI